MIGGTYGKILHVDLTSGEIRVENPPDDFYRLLVGGRAVVAYLLLRDLAPGTDLENLLAIKVGNLGDGDAPGTVNPDGSVKNPPQGYMIDLVLSSDTTVPEGFAPGPDGNGAFKEDALLAGGRVSRTLDVKANSSLVLPAGPIVSSDVGGIIPSQTPDGSYYLCARIDPGQEVLETDESNNLTCRPITVGSLQ